MLCLRAEFTNRHRNSPYRHRAISHNRRVVLRDERTGHFLYGADYSTANGGFIGFIVFDKLRSYDNKCNMDAINTEM